jgi:hypothetical protein
MTEICNRYDSLRNYQKGVDDVFRQHNDRLVIVRKLSIQVAEDIEHLGVFLERHTAVVCPECTSVCCINRHSYHAFDDRVYIYAIGEKIPLHNSVLDDSGPCQFLGQLGCTIARSLRPYRCNWYFCSPLLADITSRNSNRQYRLFIILLQEITEKRQKMMAEYVSVVKKMSTDMLIDR